MAEMDREELEDKLLDEYDINIIIVAACQPRGETDKSWRLNGQRQIEK